MSRWPPIRLGPNQPPRFYAGGAAIAALRGVGSADPKAPEDWVASTTTLFGEATAGLTVLDDGRTLRDVVRAEPETFLGPVHTAAYGDDAALLVKLLDAGERLPVHVHPPRAFAARHLAAHHGKTEAWYVVDAADDACVHVGFTDEVPEATLRQWVDRQDTAAMLESLCRVPVSAGEAVLVPAGTPHAIGAGVFVVELQEPTDFSVMLERDAFGVGEEADLGLGAGALDCVDRTGWDAGRLAAVRRRPEPSAGEAVAVMPAAADPFFRAELLRGDVAFGPSYAVLVVLRGHGTLTTEEGELEVRRGETLLVPYAAGAGRLSGDVDVLRCLPPDPGAE